MRKTLLGLGMIALLLMATAPVNASIVWENESVTPNFMIESNGGIFYNAQTNYYEGNNNIPVPTAAGDLRTENFGDSYGSMTLEATSSGGEITDGLQTQVYTGVTFEGANGELNHFDAGTYGADVHQAAIASIQKEFINSGSSPMTINLSGDLTGSIAFPSFNSSSDSTYAYFELLGTVELLEMNDLNPGATAYTIELDPDTLTGSLGDILIRPASEGYYYILNTSLRVDAFVKNFAFMPAFLCDSLDGPFFLGSDSANPLELTATVNTPIPPSIGLLLSGIAGLVIVRRRG